jgi:hypothetical protein
MTYAMVYAENGDIVGTYASEDEAVHKLAAFVNEHPDLQDEIGLRPYKQGRPAGDFRPASEVLADTIRQQHLV